MSGIKPDLDLSGVDGNAYFILSKARRVAKQAGWADADIQAFIDQAKSGDYDHLLQTCEMYFEVY